MRNNLIKLILVVVLFATLLLAVRNKSDINNYKNSNYSIYLYNSKDTVYIDTINKIRMSKNQRNNMLTEDVRVLALQFHNTLYDTLSFYANEYNIPVEVLIARAVRESYFNTSALAYESNNLFGIKYFNTELDKKYATNYKHYTDLDKDGFPELAKFCVYENYTLSIKHFCEFIQTKRYKKLNPKTFTDYTIALCKNNFSIPCNPKDDISAWNMYKSFVYGS